MLKTTIIRSESEMLNFGRELAKTLSAPTCLELVGDVGAGKTTLTRGLAAGLKIKEPVSSPSFTISKVYPFAADNLLVHYDFYRLSDPGLMSEDLLENLSDPHVITVVEWGDTVADLLPARRRRLAITLNDDGSRTVEETAAEEVPDVR